MDFESTHRFSGAEISAIHLMTMVMRTMSPPPTRSKKQERSAFSVVHNWWSQTTET